MPTYLTPGVYVEEVPSASKPIEGVGTSIAAFVGLAPGGPVNTAMRISNWTQFSKIYGDPEQPDNGPFMEGAYLAHSVYGFFMNGGSMCWIVRVGDESGGARPRAALPAATDKGVEAFRAEALGTADDEVKVELSQEASASDKDADATYKLVVTSGSEREEFDGLTLKKGRTNIATKVNASSKLVKITDQSESLPEGQRAPATGTYTLSKPAPKPEAIKPTHFEGDVAKRRGMGSLAAVDEVTMVCMPDLMTLAGNGDDVALRDLQGKMIAHCENAGDRMAIIDAPPDLLPQEILEWRMNTAGYDSKMAALYYPWIEVMDPLTNRPIMIPPSGHVAGVWCRTDGTRGVHKAPANEVVHGRQRPRLPGHPGRAGRAQQGRHQLHPGIPWPRHPDLGGAYPLERSGVALHQRAPALQLHRASRSWRARSGACSSRTTSGSGSSCRSRPATSCAACGGRGALRHRAVTGLLREV